MNTAGVLRDVAADRARRLARWVGNIMQAEMGHGARDVRIDDAGLNYGNTIGFVDFQNFAHPRQLDNDSIVQRQRTA